MKRKAIFNFQFSIFNCLLLFASCGDPGGGDALPGGKYPVTFSAAVDGLAVSRAATADGTWTAGDAVAVRVGDVVKRYAPTSINGNSAMLAGTDAANTFYWQTSGETKTATAWYTGTGYSATLPATWAVQSNQSGEGYRQSDFLYAPAVNIAFSGRGTASLPFYHQTARVVINIVKAEAATSAADISAVRVGNANNLALSGTYTAPAAGATAGTWTNTATMGTITPRDITAGGTYLKTYAALVIPRNMKGKKFIAVTMTDGDTYYYTPASDHDANLESGKQYTYTITVKRGKLEVTSPDITAWTVYGSEQVIDSYIPLPGSGTEAEPFRVASFTDFKKIKYNLDAHYLQTAEIDMNNENFNGIGSFTGTYDGGGYEIKNAKLTGYGLFRANDGMIKNVKIRGTFEASNPSSSAAICANNKGTITGCINYVNIRGSKDNVGGICGDNTGTISDCTNNGYISMSASAAYRTYGGICAVNEGAIINCTNTGYIIAGMFHNSICGENHADRGGTITGCKPSDQNTN